MKNKIGQVVSVKDGVAYVSGMTDVAVGEKVIFLASGLSGMALNLEVDRVGCIIFGDDSTVQQDDYVGGYDFLVKTRVGPHLLGRVVDAIGEPIDGKNNYPCPLFSNIERKAPGVITRESVTEPMLTGYKIVDCLLPIGRGQRELIVGDRQTGKTTIAIDTILNQRNNNERGNIDLYCVYVGIGQKKKVLF